MFRTLDQRTQSFYNTVAKMVSRVNNKLSTIKKEVYSTKTPERYQALLHKVLINYKILRNVVKDTNFMKNIPLGVVLAYEILTKKIKNDGFRRKLRQAMKDQKLKNIKTRTFIRINTLKASEEDIKDFITKKTCIPNVYEVFDTIPDETVEEHDSASVESYDENVDDENIDDESVDDENNSEEDIEDTADSNVSETSQKMTYKKIRDLFKTNLVPEKVKVQNFASCLPAFILNPEPESTVIDATASPGNKTTHLCSIMNNTGKIYAFERNEMRYKTLVEQVEKYGASNIETCHSDFLKVSPEKYNVDYILLDPSCSGSGIHVNYRKDKNRINKLKNFQAMMLNHAFKFNPKAVVYSVCSIHKEEGEDVVKEALEKNPEYEVVDIENYTDQRGYKGYEFSDKVIRTSNEDDKGTIGFFVALFRKRNQ